jgi:transcriptional accessory protein Tex/SPT6
MILLPQMLCLLYHQILAERISAWPAARQAARAVVQQRARVTAKLKKPAKAASSSTASSSTAAGAKRKRSESNSTAAAVAAASKFSDYAQYISAIERVQPHQWLALRRGAACKELTVTVTLPADSSNAAAERVVSSTVLCCSSAY